jgi:DNA polymerase III delta prime subunit
MHAFLIVGALESEVKTKINELQDKIKAEILEFPVEKIDDVRNLNSFVRLLLTKKTAILIKNVENATHEALNAFLKNLEEPQEKLYFILTASSIYRVLPTIVSRCQIIKAISNQQSAISNETKNFIKMTVAQKLAFLDKIKKREGACDFVLQLIEYLHQQLLENGNYRKLAKNIAFANQTLERLKANGNVNLQLTYLAINLS